MQVGVFHLLGPCWRSPRPNGFTSRQYRIGCALPFFPASCRQMLMRSCQTLVCVQFLSWWKIQSRVGWPLPLPVSCGAVWSSRCRRNADASRQLLPTCASSFLFARGLFSRDVSQNLTRILDSMLGFFFFSPTRALARVSTRRATPLGRSRTALSRVFCSIVFRDCHIEIQYISISANKSREASAQD